MIIHETMPNCTGKTNLLYPNVLNICINIVKHRTGRNSESFQSFQSRWR